MITLPSEIATSAGMFVFAIVQALILLVLAPLCVNQHRHGGGHELAFIYPCSAIGFRQ